MFRGAVALMPAWFLCLGMAGRPSTPEMFRSEIVLFVSSWSRERELGPLCGVGSGSHTGFLISSVKVILI